jgi:hypothetical protein
MCYRIEFEENSIFIIVHNNTKKKGTHDIFLEK